MQVFGHPVSHVNQMGAVIFFSFIRRFLIFRWIRVYEVSGGRERRDLSGRVKIFFVPAPGGAGGSKNKLLKDDFGATWGRGVLFLGNENFRIK